LKVKRQLRDVQRLFKLQNAKWSYVPTCMPMTPFTWRRHILVIFPLIWVIFVTLQSILKFKYNRMTFKDLLSYKMQTSHMCQPTCPWPPSLGEGTSWSFLIDLSDFCCIGCAKWKVTNCFGALKATEQRTMIYKFLSLSYQHIYPSSCN
jgi:hypothetical protein